MNNVFNDHFNLTLSRNILDVFCIILNNKPNLGEVRPDVFGIFGKFWMSMRIWNKALQVWSDGAAQHEFVMTY